MLVLGNMLSKTDMLILKKCRYFLFLIHYNDLNFKLYIFPMMDKFFKCKVVGGY
jgi:hypothetical protein